MSTILISHLHEHVDCLSKQDLVFHDDDFKGYKENSGKITVILHFPVHQKTPITHKSALGALCSGLVHSGLLVSCGVGIMGLRKTIALIQSGCADRNG